MIEQVWRGASVMEEPFSFWRQNKAVIDFDMQMGNYTTRIRKASTGHSEANTGHCRQYVEMQEDRSSAQAAYRWCMRRVARGNYLVDCKLWEYKRV